MGKWEQQPATPSTPNNPSSPQVPASAAELAREEAISEALEANAERTAPSSEFPYAPYYPPAPLPAPVPEPTCTEYESHLYVTSYGILYVLNPITGAVEHIENLGNGYELIALTFDPDNRRLYASKNEGYNDLQIFDATGHLLSSQSYSDHDDHYYMHLVADPDRHLLYLGSSDYDDYTNFNTINIIDTDTSQIIQTITTEYLVLIFEYLDPATGDVYFGGVGDSGSTIWRIDGGSHDLTLLSIADETLAMFGSTANLAYNRQIFFILNTEELYVYDIDTNTWTFLINVAAYNTDILTYDPIKNRIYVSQTSRQTLSVYDINTGAYWPVIYNEGGYIHGITFDPDSEILYMMLVENEQVYVMGYDTNTWATLFTTNIGERNGDTDLVLGKFCVRWSNT